MPRRADLSLGPTDLALRALRSGRSALLVTSEDASSCWQSARDQIGGTALVIASSARGLGERAEQLADAVGLVACHLDASQNPATTTALGERLAAGHFDVVLVSVRQLGDPIVRAAALAAGPRPLVIEDADRLSRHSDRFDPSYERIPSLVAELRACPVLAIAEVASRPVLDDIGAALSLPLEAEIVGEIVPPELRLEVRNTPGRALRDAHLLGLLRARPVRGVVFVAGRADAERLAWLVREELEVPAEAVVGGSADFVSALRRFREGSTRFLIVTGSLDTDEDWPSVPLVVHYSLPESLAQYYRQAVFASGNAGSRRSVLLYDRAEKARLEHAAWRCAPEPGHLLALHRAAQDECGGRLNYATLRGLTGLHPDAVHIGVEALATMGALRMARRGDDWFEARAVALPAGGLSGYARAADALRRARLEAADQVIAYCRSRGCRRKALAKALGVPSAGATADCCDRCQPEREEIQDALPPGHSAYPLVAGEFRGWALSLEGSPGTDAPSELPARLLHTLRLEGDEEVVPRLAYLMARCVRARPELRLCNVIVPVPVRDPDDESSPPLLLATALAGLLKLPVTQALVATDTGDSPAFEVVGPAAIRGRRVLLLDDTFDTGQTLAEAALMLRGQGASEVDLLTAVRTDDGLVTPP